LPELWRSEKGVVRTPYAFGRVYCWLYEVNVPKDIQDGANKASFNLCLRSITIDSRDGLFKDIGDALAKLPGFTPKSLPVGIICYPFLQIIVAEQ
jgi:hypothetical protein